MALGKKKVIVYTDWIIQFKDLTDEEAGKLIKHFFNYINDLNPKSDRLTELLFNPIKATLKRDLKSWENKQQINKENGLKGGRPKKNKETEINPNNPVGFLKTQNNPEKGVNDNVNVNVNINNIKDINTFDFKKSCMSLGIEKNIINDWLIVRKGKKASNTQTAFDLIKSELEKTELTANECIKIAVQNSWSGFKADWLKKLDIPINKITGEEEYMINVMKQVNQIRNDIK